MAARVSDETPETPEQADRRRMTEVLVRLADQAPVQEIGFGHPKYQERLQAEGFMDAFEKPVFQNGKEANARGLKPETLERAPKLRAGSFLGGKVDVAIDQRGRVHLHYAHAKVEDRMRFQAIVRDFDDLIEKLWTEQHAS